MKVSLLVENIKCGGCANSIKQKLMAIEGVDNVAVEVEAGKVDFDIETVQDQESLTSEVKQTLLTMGYPEKGSVEGLKAAGAKAKSYVSCAVGKMGSSDKE